MVRRTLRKQRGGGMGVAGNNGNGFNGASLQSGGKRRRKNHSKRKTQRRRKKNHNRRKRFSRRKRGGNPAIATPAVLLAAQKLVQHNGLGF